MTDHVLSQEICYTVYLKRASKEIDQISPKYRHKTKIFIFFFKELAPIK